MFNDFQKGELAIRLKLILEQSKAGRADDRDALAERLAEAASEYASTQFTANKQVDGPPGVVRSSDVE